LLNDTHIRDGAQNLNINLYERTVAHLSIILTTHFF
jgi:hypothetical protein